MVTQRAKPKPSPRPSAATKRSRKKKDPPLGSQMAEIARSIPASAWRGFPRDASARFDEYLESGKFDKQ
jgi:hypothetical protein